MKPQNSEETGTLDLKAWCRWKREQKDFSEADELLVKAIEDTISLVGTWKGKYEKARGELELTNKYGRTKEDVAFIQDLSNKLLAAEARAEKFRAVLEGGRDRWCGAFGFQHACEAALREDSASALAALLDECEEALEIYKGEWHPAASKTLNKLREWRGK